MESATSSTPPSAPRPMLQKPPGYRDPNTDGKPTPPPRKPVLPPAFKPKPRRRGCCRICCCTFCIIFLLILLALVATAALAYVFYSPSLPEFHLVSFSVPKFNVTDNDGAAYLDADTTARVEVKNSNKKIAWYLEKTEVDVSADNGNLMLGSSKVGDLAVKAKEVAELKVGTKVREEALDARQRKRVKSMVQSRGMIPTVEVRSRAGVGLQGWRSWKIDVTLECGGVVTMKHLEDGDNAPLCTITLLKWIKLR